MHFTKLTILLLCLVMGAPLLSFSQNSSSSAKVLQQQEAIRLKGIIIDEQQKHPLEYVIVGVLNKPLGTVTDTGGAFDLLLSKENLRDTIQISMVGYESRRMPVQMLLSLSGKTIGLNRRDDVLKEAVITAPKLRSEVVGRQKRGGVLRMSLQPKEGVVLGGEVGVKIKAKKSPAVLKDFSWYVGANNTEKVKFRINIYSLKHNLPDSLLFHKEIYAELLNQQTGWAKVELEPYNILIEDDFAISLQWVAHQMENDAQPIFLIPGALTPFHASYYRIAGQDQWKKLAASLSYQVTLLY